MEIGGLARPVQKENAGRLRNGRQNV